MASAAHCSVTEVVFGVSDMRSDRKTIEETSIS